MAITITAPYGTLSNLPDSNPRWSIAGVPVSTMTPGTAAVPPLTDSYSPIAIVESAIAPVRRKETIIHRHPMRGRVPNLAGVA
jgi:hypothetical protein